MREIATTPDIETLIAAHAPVSISVSGGKDSCAVAFAVNEYLDQRRHMGPRLLVHSDLGRVEWKDSLPTCERLAGRLGIELVTLRRAAGDMMDRWQSRWANSVKRYTDLECVKLILPWSTATMRFCTAELKRDVICSHLRQRFAGQTTLSVCGIRRGESRDRKRTAIARPQPRMHNKTTDGVDWNAIADWSEDDVYQCLAEKDFPLHDAYLNWNMGRVSCVFCMLAKHSDHQKAAACPDNVEIYREMVGLEIDSTFAFQDDRWLGDVAPELLTEVSRRKLRDAKLKADERRRVESAIPDDLLYVKGWPIAIPTKKSARMLCTVRKQMAAIMGFPVNYSSPTSLIERYVELWTKGHAGVTA